MTVTPSCWGDAAGERRGLLALLPAGGRPGPSGQADPAVGCNVLRWAASGGMWLTGWPGRPPRPGPASFFTRLDVLAALLADATAAIGRRVEVRPETILFGRAALAGLSRQGRISAGGSCRLLRSRDGWLACNLARPEDVAGLPALVCSDVVGDPWGILEQAAAKSGGAELAARAQLLGIPAAVLPPGRSGPLPPPFSVHRFGDPTGGRRQPLTVVDLSSMWAGPLCGYVLGLAGARVIKMEARARPDGAREMPTFFDWLHAGQECVTVDLASRDGIDELRRLLDRADVVIESSRPRALRQLGIHAEELLAAGSGCSWVSVTGYGRQGATGHLVAFGDDGAVAGRLVAYDEQGDPVFCGDALADPLTGLYAALAASASIAAGGGHLIDVNLRDAAGYVADGPAGADDHPVEAAGDGRWAVRHGELIQEVLPPPRPPVSGSP